ncbi:MAG: acyl carrier protein [Mycobacteriaceae bacterium]|nr:acyl carrier protein [Mycobacteriaceae bacterium]MBV9638703.1 acyl carrier protein [Mycobacteriaceae bacterium]
MSAPIGEVSATVLSIVAGLAPDRTAPVTLDADLVDDLGYDSPRKMELVATLESRLGRQLPDPAEPVHTVADVVEWVSSHVGRTA